MSYRPSAVQPRGRWALYLHQMRRDRDWSQQQSFEALREGLHLGPKSRASYVAIDMGHRAPTPAEATFLVRYFGVGPDDLPELTSGTEPADALLAALAAQTSAITAQTAAIAELVAEMRRGRAAQAGVLEGIERGLLVAASIREAGASEASSEPPSHGGSGPGPRSVSRP